MILHVPSLFFCPHFLALTDACASLASLANTGLIRLRATTAAVHSIPHLPCISFPKSLASIHEESEPFTINPPLLFGFLNPIFNRPRNKVGP
jgi:hypothetical protein